MQDLPYIQKMLMGCCGTSRHELWGKPKELTAEQKMEEQRSGRFVNPRNMIDKMVKMCKHNINEIASYWYSNFDRVNQSALDKKQIFEQIKQAKACIKKVERIMENTKLKNEKDFKSRSKRAIYYTLFIAANR